MPFVGELIPFGQSGQFMRLIRTEYPVSRIQHQASRNELSDGFSESKDAYDKNEQAD
jgi:hypothetical protein